MNLRRRIPLLGIVAALAGCGGGGGGTEPVKLVPTSIVVTLATGTTLVAGTTVQFTATVKDQNGGVMSGQPVIWITYDPTRAPITATGAVTGMLIGSASISATSGALTSNAVTLTIVVGPAAALVKLRDVASGILVGASDSIAVRVTDGGGNPVAGTTVNFAITAGGGSLPTGTSVSGSDGVAGVRWVMSTAAGAQTATASATSLTGSPVQFSATAVAGPASTITKVGSDPVLVPAQSSVDSIKVKVGDQFGNPKAGELVAFAVTAGGGAVSPLSVTTGADGLAAARWTMGAVVGAVNTVTATRAGFAVPTVTFNTTTTLAVVATLSISGSHIVVLDSGAALSLAPTARDANGGVVPGAALTIVSRSPAMTVTNGVVTGAQRGSTFLVVASAQTPSAKDSIYVTVAVPGAPVAITDLPRLDLKTDTTLTVGVSVDMRANPAKLGATTIQVTWDPTVLAYVSDADGSAGAGATVNTTGTSTGSLTMSVASSTGFSGAVQLRKITFKAASVAARSGVLALFVSELTTATTYATLLPTTVAAVYPVVIR